MKKLFLTLLLVMVGMTSLAQSGWSDPSGNYQEQTVVYVTVDCGEYDIYSGVTGPQVAAFIGDEIRALATSYQMLGNYKVFALRVGGTSDDNGSVIDFKFYDPVSGLVYPLEMTDEQYEAAEITYQGDYTYQENQSIKLFTGSATPANEMRFTYYDVEHGSIFMNVGDVMTIEDGGSIEYLFVSPTNGEEIPATTPEVTLEWDLSSYDNAGNQASHYVSIKENVITALNSTPYGINVTARAGSLQMSVNIFVYQPVTEIAIEDADIYLGVGRFVPDVTYNGGDSYPTNPGVTFSVESEEVVRIVGGTTIVPVAKGTVTVTAVADDNPEVATTFQVNVLSALQEFTYKGEIEFTIYDENSKDMMGSVNPPIFHWVYDDSGAPVIKPNEEYTIASEDPSVVLVEYDDTGTKFTVTAVKKGETNLVFTSKYDPTMSVKVRTVIRQAVYGVNFLTVNGEDVSGAETRPMADIYVNETVTVVAELNPADADYTDFSFRFVTSDGEEIPTETIGVEVVSTKISGGQCIMDFVFNTIPDVEVCIEAQADGVRSDNVLLNVYNRVENIDVSLLDEYWIDSDGDIFEFKYAVTPGNVKNEEFTVESSNPRVAEILKSEDEGIYQLLAYAPGEVTFTFKSDENPDVAVEYSTVIKRTPTGVAITKVGSIEIPAPGTTPAETVVEIAVGQTVVAIAGIEPNDATYDSFEFRLVNDDDIPYEADVVTIGDRIDNGDGTISIGFTFNSLPDRDVYLKAVVRYSQYDNETSLQHRIRIDVRQGVTDIAVSEEVKTIWFTEGMEEFFTIQATVYPDDATNEELEISIDDESVIEYIGVSEEVDGEYRFVVLGKGTATITFTSVDNPSVSATCEVTAMKRVSELVVEGDFYSMFNDGQEYMATLSYFPVDADFNLDGLMIDIVSDLPEGWVPVEIEQGDMADGFMHLNLIPRAICNNFMIDFIYHNPEDEMSEPYIQSIEAAVMERMTMGSGWNWISLINGEIWTEELGEQLIEARSQDELMFNDASWGLFGDLYTMDNTQAYKVNIHEDYGEVELYPYSDNNIEGYIHTKSLKKGWNWVSYPYEFEYGVEQIFAAANFSENDMILSKNDGFVQRNADGVWEGGLSELVPYQGYMVYCSADIEFAMPGRYDLPQSYFVNSDIQRAASRERATWVYDNSRFANSMAIVAKVDVENCEDYTIGAFVGDECRGDGKFINGKAFISVGGESGENISFRLLNKWTGELLDVAQEIPFGDMAGSISAPMLMGTIDGTTGIDEVKGESGNVKAVYDLTGRKVEQMTEGIYVIEVREGDKIVTKKVRK